ncbi:MAG: helix-turn-helix transcriptional regulator [Bacteroidales bacterium]|nr:helix-turn-helix transcriptional regulator [Bacteroidales bacterium]
MKDAGFQIRKVDAAGAGSSYSRRPDDARYYFSYILSGEMLADVQGVQYLCSAGHLILLPAGTAFRVEYYKDITAFEGSFSPFFPKDVSYPALHLGGPLHQAFWFEQARFLGELFTKMLEADSAGNRDMLRSLLDLVLCHLRLNEKAGSEDLAARFLHRVFDRSLPILGVPEYARELRVSQTVLRRAVKRKTSHSVSDWIGISRIELAKTLLRRGDLSVLEVSLAVGIDDQSYFSRLFKKSTGTTPRLFKKS